MAEGLRQSAELLAPAGGLDQMKAAIAAGADAVYCGYGQTFNARRGAESFGADTFAAATRMAHLAGAKVYVTVNVVIQGQEMASVLALVRRAWLLGADAFIIQDWGLLDLVSTLYPKIECHLSTQANVHDAVGVSWAHALGARRVTLSRELSLEEIARIAGTGVELECFCHGAICICYSGICQMSSSAGRRSANRGECAQPCRLPYELVDERGRVLSMAGAGRPLCPRDICTLDDLDDLVSAGAASLKVEGRLKGADYVFSVVSAYRSALDDLERGVAVAPEVRARRETVVRRAFNRDFTDAYLKGTSGNEMMSYERSNNRGERVGSVVGAEAFGSVKVRRGGKGGGRERLRTQRVCEVECRLERPVDKGDLLEVRPLSDPTQFFTTYAPHDAEAGQTIVCSSSRVAEKGSVVRVIRSKRAMDEAAACVRGEVPRKRAVEVRICARLGEPFRVELTCPDGAAHAAAEGAPVEAARTRAVSREDLIEHVGRMGSSFAEPCGFEVEFDEGVGIAFSAVHAVRTEALRRLEEAILLSYESREMGPTPSAARLAARARAQLGPALEASEPLVCAFVGDAASAAAALEAGASRIYARSDVLSDGSWPQDVVCVLGEVCRERDRADVEAALAASARVACGNVSELVSAQEAHVAAEVGPTIPVHNAHALSVLVGAGAVGVWLSNELTLAQMQELCAVSPVPLGALVLGRARAMTCEHCVLQVAGRCIDDCATCGLRRRECSLRGQAGELFPVRTDTRGLSRVFSSKVTDVTPETAELVQAGIAWLGVDCTLLDARGTSEWVRRVVRALKAARQGWAMPERLRGATTGHLFEGIG